jgi:hypothetical protein
MIDAGEEASMATQPYKTVPVVEQTQGSDFATYVKPSATIKLVSSVRDRNKARNINIAKIPSPLVGEGWGEGLRSIDRPEPLTRIASADAT